MRALNFYSSNYHNHLVGRRKTCTIRLGDKTQKYAEGDLLWITVGKRYTPKKRIYTAMIDRVLVKPISQLTLGDLQAENPDFTAIDNIVEFLHSIYDKTITPEDTVTVIYFSEVAE
ncbi:MAG TPA: ASCH domain-containing protein [Patescibacteria group bacterium]|nr:ASCH domain-containing protein [Patescibacteria group bacterium]